SLPSPEEGSAEIAFRVQAARNIQTERFSRYPTKSRPHTNAEAEGKVLEEITRLGQDELNLMQKAADKFRLSARAYYRVLKVSRTIADLEGIEDIATRHIAEALRYRRNKVK
ncbi:AAA family ATPase, partial [Rhodospirillales bacterium 47_12_T64]